MPNILEQKLVFDGKVVKVRLDRVIEPSGQEVLREVVAHPGAVAIVARPAPDEVILIRQYRHPAGEELIEIPAGTLKQNEDPRACALRELEEETGFRAGRMVQRARFFTTPGFTTEIMYLFEASDLVKTRANPDWDESIEVDIVPRKNALRMVEEGRIRDAKTIVGLLMVLGRP